jgi:citrate synthase
MSTQVAVSISIDMKNLDKVDPHRAHASGLEDVVAAHTALSDVDGEAGRLLIGGYTVEELSGSVTFEQAVFLLWHGRFPSAIEHADFRAQLGAARAAAHFSEATHADPMDELRSRVGALNPADNTALLGAIGVAATTGLLAPEPSLSHAADLLRLATGHEPTPAAVAALDAYLVAVIDHGMNASTFTARVIASTASDSVSALTGAIGALKGKLHGGAPGPVLDMLDEIGDADRAADWIRAALARGDRIMGMGHRVYRTRDPRAFVLERALSALQSSDRLALARATEREAEAQLAEKQPSRALKANVEFYTAVLLEAVGLPRALFTPMFAASRAAGWIAHIEEQRATGRLIRPKSVFVGPVFVGPGAGTPVKERLDRSA